MHGTNLPSQNSLIRSNQWAWEAVDNEESDMDSEEINDEDQGDDEQHIRKEGISASKHTREPSSASEKLVNATATGVKRLRGDARARKRLRGDARARRRRVRLAGSGGFHVSTPGRNATTAQENAVYVITLSLSFGVQQVRRCKLELEQIRVGIQIGGRERD
ncbi:hypothetical protein C8J55DRAFT_486375 [Lentinula edodes]|uniref:Uncharacterized protein n=1 Tax=Lentinula lateritia TaxID=40482 RepID=A0A9W9DXR7_9AGAR|nr:hypothetical protein C8J55DRAFT_486375 [Lentinula edodes]